MLHILLLILKIIGITLGILIGIIILMLCLALFVPVRYRVNLERTEGASAGEGAQNKAEIKTNPPIEVKAKVTWLLHFINVRLIYDGELNLRLRVLFLTIFRMPAKHKRKAGKTKRDKTKADKAEKSQEPEQTAERVKADEESSKNSEPEDIRQSEKVLNSENEIKKSVNDDVDQHSQYDFDNEDFGEAFTDADETGEEDTAKLSLKEKLLKICGFFKKIRYTIRTICDKIKNIFENIEYYINIIKGDTFKSSFLLCKEELGRVLSYIKPRKFKGEWIVGTGDPASTGQIIAYYYAILYPLLGPDFTVVGDFEQKRLEGSLYIKGKVKLFTIIRAAFRVYFSKDIRKLLKLFKKEDE